MLKFVQFVGQVYDGGLQFAQLMPKLLALASVAFEAYHTLHPDHKSKIEVAASELFAAAEKQSVAAQPKP